MTNCIYILNGHPAQTSLNRTMAETYAQAARAAGHDVRITHIGDIDFDQDFGFAGYAQTKPLEPTLEAFVSDLEWCNHFVIFSPMWWGGIPAKLKGLFDRALLPGRAFDTRVLLKSGMPSPLLGGRRARIVITSDTPRWFLSLIYRNAMVHQLRGHILAFVGIKPAPVTFFAGTSHPKAGHVQKWLNTIKSLGTAAA